MIIENKPEVLVPIPIDGYWGESVDFVAEQLIEQYQKYGFDHFSLMAPSNGQLNVGVATTEYYLRMAEKFNQIKEKVSEYPIQCGWWVGTTLHTGENPGAIKCIDISGNEVLYKTCPLDEQFAEELSKNIALFAKLTKPAFIVLEDDFCTHFGCFCQKHLEECATCMGRFYSREEIKEFNDNPTSETMGILRAWREFCKNIMVDFSKKIRQEVDKENPEIPIGSHQSGGSDFEGFSSEEVARALAGERHTPFSRIYTCPYEFSGDVQMPESHFHLLYCKQHFGQKFKFLHESDTYPHLRFFCSANRMKTMMAMGYSYGLDGSVFWTVPFFGLPDDETGYSKMFAKEKRRFSQMIAVTKQCRVKGAELTFDPFFYSCGKALEGLRAPLWTRILGNFGIGYTSDEADVAFWDETMASCADDETIKRYLAKGLFLDGEAAKILCDRGYGKYLGVEMGEVVMPKVGYFDQCSYEIIKDGLVDGIGNVMANSRVYCPLGNGFLRRVIPNEPNCEVISEVYNIRNQFSSVAMTRFENSLGGRIVVMGNTLKKNMSPSLYNHPRQTLLQNLIKWCCDEFVFIRNCPNVFCIMNECVTGDFIGALTIVNLNSDDCENTHVYLPPKWRNHKELLWLNQKGDWEPLRYEKTEEGIVLKDDIKHLAPLFIMAK